MSTENTELVGRYRFTDGQQFHDAAGGLVAIETDVWELVDDVTPPPEPDPIPVPTPDPDPGPDLDVMNTINGCRQAGSRVDLSKFKLEPRLTVKKGQTVDISGRRLAGITNYGTVVGDDFHLPGSGIYTLLNHGMWQAGHGTINGGASGKAVLNYGDIDAAWLHSTRGEDAWHLVSGEIEIVYCVGDEIEYPSGAHADALQMTSKGAGARLRAYRCVMQAGRYSNSPFQLNRGQLAEIEECYLWGGGYAINGDPGPFGETRIRNNWFAYGTFENYAANGIPSVFPTEGSMWADPALWPRKDTTPSSRIVPWETRQAGFPGNNVLIGAA